MSKAGQNTFTGISDQADIALLYLLRACRKSDFQKIIIEGTKWEDFTLVFNDHTEDYEVKSYNRPITYRDVKSIVAKEITKQYGEKDILKIAAKKFSNDFKKGYKHIKESLYWWSYLRRKDYLKNPVVKKFIKKGWSENEIAFLLRAELIEFEDIKNIHQQISEFFAYEDDFYYDPLELIKVTSVFFKDIMSKGKKGDVIFREQFIDKLEEIKKHIANYSGTFPPDLSLGKQLGNLKRFLKSEKSLLKLNHQKYLSAITKNPRLIFYLADKLTHDKQFHVNDFNFIIEKILLKKCYVELTLKILEEKRKQGKVEDKYLLNFMIENYRRLVYDFNYDAALEIVRDIARKDINRLYKDKIYDFFENSENKILIPFSKERKRRYEKEERGWREDEQVAKILEIFYHREKDKKSFIDFLFKYFDFTGDDSENVIETHPVVYSFVKDFITQNPTANFDYAVKKISEQFDTVYNNKYEGYEWSGGGISQSGSSYSITDIGIVRNIFQPLFMEIYKKDSKEAMSFFRQKILKRAGKKATKCNPLYLKRALIPILIDRLIDEKLDKKQKAESFTFLANILKMKEGIPHTSEVIFAQLRNQSLKKIGFDKIMKLINIDSIKYKRRDNPAGYPTNLFVIEALFVLIKDGYIPAKRFFIDLVKKLDFVKRDRWYDSFELLVEKNITEADPGFIVGILKNLNLENYLNSVDHADVENKAGIIGELIKKDWQDNTKRGEKIINKLLKNKIPSKNILAFIGTPIMRLAQQDALRTYELFKPYLKNKQTFRKVFQNNAYTRQNIVWLAEELAKKKHYKEAKKIIELCIDDLDPQTHNREGDFNYHLQVKKGEERTTISTVRGSVAWVLQKFVVSNDPKLMKYALGKIEELLDLDGKLARKLGYSEPDLYVRLQALVPLVEIAHPTRRKMINEYKSNLGNRIKNLAFKTIKITDEQIKSTGANPKAILKNLTDVFSYIRDLNTEEAKEVLAFFEDHNESEAHFLFIYFAEFRENEYRDIPFNAKYFKEKLKEICKDNDIFRPNIAWRFWRIVRRDEEEGKNNFEKIEQYWKLLLNKYQKKVFDNFYRTLEITLAWPGKYAVHKELLKKAIQKETEYIKKIKQPVQIWGPRREIFQILKEHNNDDFLEVFYCLVKNINENIHYFGIVDWIKMFKSIKPTTQSQRNLHNKITTRLKDLYPEYLEN